MGVTAVWIGMVAFQWIRAFIFQQRVQLITGSLSNPDENVGLQARKWMRNKGNNYVI